MARIVNLRTVRKQRARDAARDKATAAAPDRVERDRARAEAAREAERHEAHRRDSDTPPD